MVHINLCLLITLDDDLHFDVHEQVMGSPVIVYPCKHIFDKSAIDQYRITESKRLSCRKKIDGVEVNMGLKDIIREAVKTKCTVPTCEKTMPIGKLGTHVKYYCQHARYV